MDDSAIVDLFFRRDEAAIQTTQEKFGVRLRALALGIVQDSQTAEECENDTYLHAWNAIPPHAPRSYLYAFLARITRHVALNCCRERKSLKRCAHLTELSAELEQCLAAPDNCAARVDDLVLAEAINGFLATLREEQRNIFLRRYWYLDSISAIAAYYSLSESKVKSALFRCRNKFRDYLEKEGYTL